jgi:TM2 domain-containing membrane protein YozV
MLNKDDVEAEEERLRADARQLPDEARAAFFREVTRQLRDPDTYAVLNWFFLAGLHHFYLGRWGRGLFDLGFFLAGIVLIAMGQTLAGIVFVLFISIVELWALFRSQIIVHNFNNEIYRRVLRKYYS